LAKPWWESSAEDESASTDAIQSWFKTPTVKEEDEILEDEEQQATKKNPDEGQFKQPPSDLGVSVTMSKDSLDDGGRL
jgi:hypothetical protein